MRFNRCAILTEGGRSAVGETQTSLRVTQPSRGLHRSLTRLQKNTFVSVAHSVTYHDLSLTSDSNGARGKCVGVGGEFSQGGLKTLSSLALDVEPNAFEPNG